MPAAAQMDAQSFVNVLSLSSPRWFFYFHVRKFVFLFFVFSCDDPSKSPTPDFTDENSMSDLSREMQIRMLDERKSPKILKKAKNLQSASPAFHWTVDCQPISVGIMRKVTWKKMKIWWVNLPFASSLRTLPFGGGGGTKTAEWLILSPLCKRKNTRKTFSTTNCWGRFGARAITLYRLVAGQ